MFVYAIFRMSFKIRVLLSRSESGAIIGIRGENIKLIRAQSMAKIHFDRDDSYQRVVSISGTVEQIKICLDLFTDNIEEKFPRAGRKYLKLLLDDRKCKMLVMRKAGLLQTITKETGVKVIVSPFCLPGSSERIVKVEEGRGNLVTGVTTVYEKLKGSDNGDLVSDKLFTPPKRKNTDKLEEDEVELQFMSNFGSIIGKVYALSKKLGVKVKQESQTTIVRGSPGAVDMFQSIANLKHCETADPTIPGNVC